VEVERCFLTRRRGDAEENAENAFGGRGGFEGGGGKSKAKRARRKRRREGAAPIWEGRNILDVPIDGGLLLG
jgi:hypothetical protein